MNHVIITLSLIASWTHEIKYINLALALMALWTHEMKYIIIALALIALWTIAYNTPLNVLIVTIAYILITHIKH